MQKRTRRFVHNDSVYLWSGRALDGLEVEFTTYGELNERKDNVVWVCHALTANSEVGEWWPGMVGPDLLLDTDQYFIVCANVLGGCYGSSGPLAEERSSGKPFYHHFPDITITDMVLAHDLLRQHLGITRIHLLIGASLGGQQALEWSVSQPELFERSVFIATNAKHSPWGIAFNESQRMAIENDGTWLQQHPGSGSKGLLAARAMALLSYRNYTAYGLTQSEESDFKSDRFKASSYQRYQGKKLVDRFNAISYHRLSKAMDSHNVGRRFDGVENALKRITAPSLIIGVSSDLLFPTSEQQVLARYIPNAEFILIDSDYGHDGFLVETTRISDVISAFLGRELSYTKVA